MFGPTLEASQLMHAGKYRGPGEPFKECMNRVASALTDNPSSFHLFRDILLSMRYMPAGRIQQAMGSTRDTCAHNCFVSGTIEDSFVDGQGSIMARATQAAQTMRKGGGIGYDFSTLRPRGSLIAKLGSQSSGPCSFIPIYNAIGCATASAGHRRGAQMGNLRVDHPDVEEFVRMKQNTDRLTGFNVSVAVTDEFMRSLAAGTPFQLRFEKRVYREIDPKVLWETIMRSTWDWAEPGVLFIDTVNSWNNLYYCETIAATNPCGEQPLPPFGACLLGSFNLVKYLYEEAGKWVFNFDQFRKDIPTVVEAMDNVVDRARYPLYEQEKEARSKRRMGLGVTGVANAIEAMGFPYGSPGFILTLDKILGTLKEVAYWSSSQLAIRKGSFPLYDREKYLAGKFVSRLSPETRDMIAEHGIRNSHLLSIAPTGTISFCADNISSSIECVIGYSVDREVQTFEGPVLVRGIPDYGVRELDVRGLLAKDVTAEEHLAVLECASRNVDSAVSKTCNVPGDMPWDDFKHLYVRAHELGCKGITTYQMGGKRGAVIKESEPEVACRVTGSCEA
jgi:ribonucleoside-diphosphate reductase alpha chain